MSIIWRNSITYLLDGNGLPGFEAGGLEHNTERAVANNTLRGIAAETTDGRFYVKVAISQTKECVPQILSNRFVPCSAHVFT